MKTLTKLALAGLTTAMFATGTALAGDLELATFDNHHGSVTYYRPAQRETTVAVTVHGKGIGRASDKTESGELHFHQITTAHGTVSYFAPVE